MKTRAAPPSALRRAKSAVRAITYGRGRQCRTRRNRCPMSGSCPGCPGSSGFLRATDHCTPEHPNCSSVIFRKLESLPQRKPRTFLIVSVESFFNNYDGAVA